MCTPKNPSGGTGGELRYPPSYSVEDYIRLHALEIDARRFAIVQTGEALAMRAGLEKRKTVIAGWLGR